MSRSRWIDNPLSTYKARSKLFLFILYKSRQIRHPEIFIIHPRNRSPCPSPFLLSLLLCQQDRSSPLSLLSPPLRLLVFSTITDPRATWYAKQLLNLSGHLRYHRWRLLNRNAWKKKIVIVPIVHLSTFLVYNSTTLRTTWLFLFFLSSFALPETRVFFSIVFYLVEIQDTLHYRLRTHIICNPDLIKVILYYSHTFFYHFFSTSYHCLSTTEYTLVVWNTKLKGKRFFVTYILYLAIGPYIYIHECMNSHRLSLILEYDRRTSTKAGHSLRSRCSILFHGRDVKAHLEIQV